MKKTMMAAAAVCCFFFSSVPSSASEIVKNYLYDYDDAPFTTIGSGFYEEIRLSAEEAARKPALAQALAGHAFDHGGMLEEEFLDYCDIIREIRGNMGDEMTASVEYTVLPQRDDDIVFSYIGYYYGYSGGAHGYYSYTGLNFDPRTGNMLELTDICSDPEQLRTVLEQSLLEKYPDGSFALSGASLASYGVSEGETPYNWVMGPQGLTFFFNPYEIASYAEGVLYIQIRFEEYPDLFREDYSSKGSYAFTLHNWMDPEYDLDGDLIPDPITLGTDYDDNGEPCGITVCAGGSTCRLDDDLSYEMYPVLLHLEDGRNYLYLHELYDNDYRGIRVIDLNGTSPFLAGDFPGGQVISSDEETGGTVKNVLADPDAFSLASHFDLLSSYTAYRNYTIGADGMPVPLDDWYTIQAFWPLTVKKPLPASGVDPVTLEADGTSVTVPAGEQLTLLRTDGISQVDLALSSGGREIRIETDASVWPHTIGGEDENNFFEMTYYAG